MAEPDFVPIKITGCDEERVKKASSNKKLYILPFTLSAKPPRPWGETFDDAWQSIRKKSDSSAKARAYVKKDEIMLECPLDNVKEVFGDLKSAASEANEKHLKVVQGKAEKNARKQQKREKEILADKLAIREALASLDFS
ncbi:MAG TPA: hypothetical protein VF131_07080 [Blastocatellia bacterium]|nr:hypothetical protein [Blastocatellia bacterium]